MDSVPSKNPRKPRLYKFKPFFETLKISSNFLPNSIKIMPKNADEIGKNCKIVKHFAPRINIGFLKHVYKIKGSFLLNFVLVILQALEIVGSLML